MPGAGGMPFSDVCPEGQIIVGFTGTWGGTYPGLGSLRATCGATAVQGNGPYAFTTVRAGTIGPRGTVSPQVAEMACPQANYGVIGFTGRSGNFIDQLVFECAPLSIAPSGASYSLSLGSSMPVPPGLGNMTGVAFERLSCGAGKVAVGMVGRYGASIDAFGLVCARPELVFSP
jgi:hypothetical protein